MNIELSIGLHLADWNEKKSDCVPETAPRLSRSLKNENEE